MISAPCIIVRLFLIAQNILSPFRQECTGRNTEASSEVYCSARVNQLNAKDTLPYKMSKDERNVQGNKDPRYQEQGQITRDTTRQ